MLEIMYFRLLVSFFPLYEKIQKLKSISIYEFQEQYTESEILELLQIAKLRFELNQPVEDQMVQKELKLINLKWVFFLEKCSKFTDLFTELVEFFQNSKDVQVHFKKEISKKEYHYNNNKFTIDDCYSDDFIIEYLNADYFTTYSLTILADELDKLGSMSCDIFAFLIIQQTEFKDLKSIDELR